MLPSHVQAAVAHAVWLQAIADVLRVCTGTGSEAGNLDYIPKTAAEATPALKAHAALVKRTLEAAGVTIA
jgi:hypothetical protein